MSLLGRADVIGAHRLLSDVIVEAIRQQADVQHYLSLESYLASQSSPSNVIFILTRAARIGEIRARIRAAFSEEADPLLVCLDENDPYVYLTQLQESHVTRRRLGLDEILDIVADHQISSSAPLKSFGPSAKGDLRS